VTSDKDARLLQRLLVTFKLEARERITALSSGLAAFDKTSGDARSTLIESIFREAHSLKAAAQSVGQKEISALCQSLEGVFSAVKRGELEAPAALFADMQAAADIMDDLLASIDTTAKPELLARASTLAQSLSRALSTAKSAQAAAAKSAEPAAPNKEVPRPAPAAVAQPAPLPTPPPIEAVRSEPAPPPAAGGVETVRLSAQRLDGLLRQAEEMLIEKAAAQQLSTVLAEARDSLAEWKREWGKVRGWAAQAQSAAETGSLDAASTRIFEFLHWNEQRMGALEGMLATTGETADGDARRLASKVDRLLWEMKEILTVPAASLLPIFQRAIRDVARDQDKEVDFILDGGELELDRRILQELKDPLLHLVRNCVDHGIERPREREAAGKPVRATVTLSVSLKDGDKVEFIVADDGAGIATRKVAETAVKLGLLPAKNAEVDEADLLQLIFQSGVSTSPMITDVSGRGLGLAIVREKVERLGGLISVETTRGQGTAFGLVVPLSLATYRAVSVRLGEQLLMIPSLGVDQVVRVQRAAVSTVENRAMLNIGQGPVPLVRLSDVLGLGPGQANGTAGAWIEAVVVGAAGRQIAFEVDSVEGDQEILMKPLGRCLVRVRNVQGATILPSGAIAPILNIHDLLKSAVKAEAMARPEAAMPAPEPSRRQNILVVEDSITARGLLRSILESAGYRVKTAVDGMDAWSMLRLERFDLVVSDVEMPRMNGFDLTGRIRADKALAELPVVLVTALESREDRERGVSAGANAYIHKGGFEQSVLLEAVRRLV
jgi:two-component system chemotaxis sensor kinase CheA